MTATPRLVLGPNDGLRLPSGPGRDLELGPMAPSGAKDLKSIAALFTKCDMTLLGLSLSPD